MKMNPTRGFTLMEIVTAITIVLILLGIGIGTFYRQRSTSQIKPIADGIVAILEHAKADAVAGKNGSNFGVNFGSTTYTYFSGSSYNASDPNNLVNTISSQFVINDTIAGGSSIIFARLSGTPSATGTITVSDTQDSSDTKIVSVGSGGEVGVVQ
jgi:type IV fimbrial biogenesis protein FimT